MRAARKQKRQQKMIIAHLKLDYFNINETADADRYDDSKSLFEKRIERLQIDRKGKVVVAEERKKSTFGDNFPPR